MDRRQYLKSVSGLATGVAIAGCVNGEVGEVEIHDTNTDYEIEDGIGTWTLSFTFSTQFTEGLEQSEGTVRFDLVLLNKESVIDRRTKVMKNVTGQLTHEAEITVTGKPEQLEDVSNYELNAEVLSS